MIDLILSIVINLFYNFTSSFFFYFCPFFLQIENLLEQLKDKDKQLSGLRERVQGLQTDSSNTDTALATLEEALSEKVHILKLICHDFRCELDPGI